MFLRGLYNISLHKGIAQLGTPLTGGLLHFLVWPIFKVFNHWDWIGNRYYYRSWIVFNAHLCVSLHSSPPRAMCQILASSHWWLRRGTSASLWPSWPMGTGRDFNIGWQVLQGESESYFCSGSEFPEVWLGQFPGLGWCWGGVGVLRRRKWGRGAGGGGREKLEDLKNPGSFSNPRFLIYSDKKVKDSFAWQMFISFEEQSYAS